MRVKRGECLRERSRPRRRFRSEEAEVGGGEVCLVAPEEPGARANSAAAGSGAQRGENEVGDVGAPLREAGF